MILKVPEKKKSQLSIFTQPEADPKEISTKTVTELKKKTHRQKYVFQHFISRWNWIPLCVLLFLVQYQLQNERVFIYTTISKFFRRPLAIAKKWQTPSANICRQRITLKDFKDAVCSCLSNFSFPMFQCISWVPWRLILLVANSTLEFSQAMQSPNSESLWSLQLQW